MKQKNKQDVKRRLTKIWGCWGLFVILESALIVHFFPLHIGLGIVNLPVMFVTPQLIVLALIGEEIENDTKE